MCSGYHQKDTVLQGFAHTYLSGTGLSGMGDILIVPITSVLKTVPGTDENPDEGYSSRWSHHREKASPGYYSVHLYNYARQPYKTQELVRRVMRLFYSDTPEGYVNNEGCGQMSSWFIMGALGFYPLCQGSNEYTLSDKPNKRWASKPRSM